MVAALLGGAPSFAQLAPPDTVWIEAETSEWVELRWPAVEEAAGYQVYREVLVAVAEDADGNLVKLETPRREWVPWGMVEPMVVEVEARLARLDSDPSRWAVATVDAAGQESELTIASEPDVLTGLQRTSWGRLKEQTWEPTLDARDAGG